MNHHPRRADREITDLNEIQRILENGKFCTIAMARENEPYLVSLSYGYDKANKRLYFHCASEGEKLDYIYKNPYVCATIIEDHGYMAEDCDHLYSLLIIRGKMDLAADISEKIRLEYHDTAPGKES